MSFTRTISFRHGLLMLILLPLSLAVYPAWAGQDILLADDLQQDGRVVREEGKPIVALVTATYCEYCETLKDEVFRFLTDDDRFLLREVVIDGGWPVQDFDGQESGHGLLGKEYKVKLTPTVLFLDEDGKALAEPLVGVLTLDYYSYYFDKRVAEATETLVERLN
ncbi:MAG: thioredoxin fold domain-containing protein [Pseudomonadota bacterium]|nr:thioredoxin fold domain-containing protein [Pseudomonadota bacterium]